MIRRYRRISQLIVFISIFIIPLLNVFEITFVKGTFYSLDIGDIAIADPLSIFQAMISSKSFLMVMLVSTIVPIMLMILLGRIWCSWMCPYYLLTEFIESIAKKFRIKLKKPTYSKTRNTRTNATRFITLLIGITLTGIAGIPLLNLISAPGLISSQALVLVKFHYITFEAAFIIFLLFMEFFYYKFWCRYFCPQGTFLSLFRNKKGLRVEKVVENCSNCYSCIRTCPMCINPMEDGLNYLCHNCGNCIDVCPDNKKTDTLKFRF